MDGAINQPHAFSIFTLKFKNPCSALGNELAALIMDGAIKARIDAHAGVLYARHANVRSATFASVMAGAEQYMRDTKVRVLSLSFSLAHTLTHSLHLVHSVCNN